MFNDFNKFLKTNLKVYFLVLIIIFIMKLIGLDYFGLDANNYILSKLNIFLDKWHITNIFYFIFLAFYQYLMISIICKDNSNKMKKFILFTLPFTAILQYYKHLDTQNLVFYFLEFVYLILICKIYNKNIKIKRIIGVLIFMFFLQFISNATRNKIDIKYEDNFIKNVLLTLDYLLMLIIYQKITLKEGGLKCQEQVGSFSQKKINFSKLLKELRKKLRNFKKQDKETKITFIIYFVLSLFWNVFTVLFILIMAKLNGTLIECLFIITSFWLSKRTFGKAFHLESMTHCFAVSSLTYYILNRITTPLGISIFIPIILGVALSYFTSKLVKKKYKPLYRGMSKELFEETILQVVDKNSVKYNICYDYFILKKSAIYLAGKYNYSDAGIRKIKDRINTKIKELD